MTIRRIIPIQVLIIICLVVTVQVGFAAGIKDRMKQRLPAIAKLKTRGIIGENNKGYLGFVSGAIEQKKMIAAENKDRKAVYNHFAKQQGTSLDVVEKVQAKRKVQKAKKGEFVQDEKGNWYKK